MLRSLPKDTDCEISGSKAKQTNEGRGVKKMKQEEEVKAEGLPVKREEEIKSDFRYTTEMNRT